MTSQTPRLAWFFGLSFVLSWMIWIPMAMGAQNVIDFKPPFVVGWLAGISPALAALWLMARERRPGGLSGFLRDRFRLRISPWVGLVALLQPFLLVALASTLQTIFTGEKVKSFEVQWGMLPMFTAIMLFLSLGEELGWRAYALPWLDHACFNMMSTFFPTIALEWSAVAVAWLFAGLVVLWGRRRPSLNLSAPAAARG